jgi:RimJ/RimL family protein N-acetyltransferase
MIKALAAKLAATPIETPRLLLEPRGERHAEAFFQPLQEDQALYRWISMQPPNSLAELRARWRRIEDCPMSPDGQCALWLCWAVRRKSDGRYLGQVDAEIILAAEGVRLEASNFGYYFFSTYWSCGYATEAVRAATQQLINTHGVQRLVATVTVGNIASARVLQKAGFAFSRVLPGNDCLRGVVVDDEEYVLGEARR